MIYLDNSATTRAFDSVAETVREQMLERYFNASAPYSAALENERLFLQARRTVSESLHAFAEEIFFTSGGTESDNTALLGTMAAAGEKRHLIISAAEHPAVYDTALQLQNRGYALCVVPVEKDGTVSPAKLAELVTKDTALVSIMHVNNEMGAVNDLAALSAAVKAVNPQTVFHSDGVQAYLRMEFPKDHKNIDMYSVSAHKIHGPKGMGALYVRRGTRVKPLLYGGGQQDNMRSGTLNMPGILGMAAAVDELRRQNDFIAGISEIKAALAERLLAIPDTLLIGEMQGSAPHILGVAFKDIQAQVLQNALEERGIIIGKGSACSSRSSKISRVQEVLEIPKNLAAGTIRISLGAFNTMDEVEPTARIMEETVQRLRKFRRK